MPNSGAELDTNMSPGPNNKLSLLQTKGRFKNPESAELAALEAYVRHLESQGSFHISEADTEDESQRLVRAAQGLGKHPSRRAAIDAAVEYYLSTIE
jgi:hypothetical protein